MARGGKREGAGRPKGVVNRETAERRATIAEMAQEYAELAVRTLAEIAGSAAASDAARVSASNAILDRAYGKPVQGVELGGKDGASLRVVFETVYESAPGEA